VSPPAIVGRLELEASPRIVVDCLNDGDKARLMDWLRAHPEYGALVEQALEIQQRERTA
jgi:hypothetical protein